MKKGKTFKCLHCGEAMLLRHEPELCTRCERANWDFTPEEWRQVEDLMRDPNEPRIIVRGRWEDDEEEGGEDENILS